MALFLDTSALFKLFVKEPGSAEVERLLEQEPSLFIGCLTHHEYLSALQRRIRHGQMTPDEALDLLAKFRHMLASQLTSIPYGETISQRALDLLERHGTSGLRPLDAVQLASCLEVPGATFCLADRMLADIAGKEAVPTAFFA